MTNKTVLFVEDEETDVFFMQRGFRQLRVPHPLQVVWDGGDAVDYLAGHGRFQDRQRYPLPGLVLLDLNLPVMRGVEVLAWLRKQPQFQTLPVVVFSGSHLESDKEKALKLGANEYVVKPTDMTKIPALLELLLNRWLPPMMPAASPARPPKAVGSGK
jgi:CheY-like chemotaxis protein